MRHSTVQRQAAAVVGTELTARERPQNVATTHDYLTAPALGRQLTSEHVLVGDSGGLSAIYEVQPSSLLQGMLRVETEHGPLYLDPDEHYSVLVA
jgi:hypothetical protein